MSFELPIPLENIIEGVAVVVVAGVLGWFYRARPKVTNRLQASEYIDGTAQDLVEEKEIHFSWGHRLRSRRRRVMVAKIPRDAKFRLFYKPETSYRQRLPDSQVEEEARDKHRTLWVRGKDFFDDADTDCIYLETMIHQAPTFAEEISVTATGEVVAVENNNRVEVRDFPIELPETVQIQDLLSLSTYGTEFTVESSTPADSPVGNRIRIFLKKIPRAEGDRPGTVSIPLHLTPPNHQTRQGNSE